MVLPKSSNLCSRRIVVCKHWKIGKAQTLGRALVSTGIKGKRTGNLSRQFHAAQITYCTFSQNKPGFYFSESLGRWARMSRFRLLDTTKPTAKRLHARKRRYALHPLAPAIEVVQLKWTRKLAKIGRAHV